MALFRPYYIHPNSDPVGVAPDHDPDPTTKKQIGSRFEPGKTHGSDRIRIRKPGYGVLMLNYIHSTYITWKTIFYLTDVDLNKYLKQIE